jgi:hypothetical protein
LANIREHAFVSTGRGTTEPLPLPARKHAVSPAHAADPSPSPDQADLSEHRLLDLPWHSTAPCSWLGPFVRHRAGRVAKSCRHDRSHSAATSNDICESYRCDRFIFVKNGARARRRRRTALVALRPEPARGLRRSGRDPLAARSMPVSKEVVVRRQPEPSHGHRRWQAVASLQDAVLSLSDTPFCTRRSGVKDIAAPPIFPSPQAAQRKSVPPLAARRPRSAVPDPSRLRCRTPFVRNEKETLMTNHQNTHLVGEDPKLRINSRIGLKICAEISMRRCIFPPISRASFCLRRCFGQSTTRSISLCSTKPARSLSRILAVMKPTSRRGGPTSDGISASKTESRSSNLTKIIEVSDQRWLATSGLCLSREPVQPDRPAEAAMRGGLCRPSQPHPMKEGQCPSFKLPPMGKGDGSLLPFPKPLSLSRRMEAQPTGDADHRLPDDEFETCSSPRTTPSCQAGGTRSHGRIAMARYRR